MNTRCFSALASVATIAVTIGVSASTADAFVITNTSASWDNVSTAGGYLIGSDGYDVANWNAVEFLDRDDANQVRWGNAAYGTQVNTWAFNWDDYHAGYQWAHGDYTNVFGEAAYGYHHVGQKTIQTYRNKSGLGYSGVSNLNVEAGDIFNIGTLTHYNQIIWNNSNVGRSAELSLNLDFGDSGLGAQTFDFTLHVDETNNSAAVCPYETSGYGCSDRISWDFAIDQQNTFDYEGEEYTLELLGFADELANSGALNSGSLINEFISEEKADNSAGLFARLVKVDTSQDIPEPTTLLGLAGIGLYFVSRKRAANVGEA